MFRIIIGSDGCCGDRGSYITVGRPKVDAGWLVSSDLRTDSTLKPRPPAVDAGTSGAKPGEKGEAMANGLVAFGEKIDDSSGRAEGPALRSHMGASTSFCSGCGGLKKERAWKMLSWRDIERR